MQSLFRGLCAGRGEQLTPSLQLLHHGANTLGGRRGGEVRGRVGVEAGGGEVDGEWGSGDESGRGGVRVENKGGTGRGGMRWREE